jgi:hypothetical protein
LMSKNLAAESQPSREECSFRAEGLGLVDDGSVEIEGQGCSSHGRLWKKATIMLGQPTPVGGRRSGSVGRRAPRRRSPKGAKEYSPRRKPWVSERMRKAPKGRQITPDVSQGQAQKWGTEPVGVGAAASYAPSGLANIALGTHGLRRGLQSFAASRLESPDLFHLLSVRRATTRGDS